LLEEGRKIGQARPDALARHCRTLQVVDAPHRLAGAAVRHDAGEALQSIMETEELVARLVVDNELWILHRLMLMHLQGASARSAVPTAPRGLRTD